MHAYLRRIVTPLAAVLLAGGLTVHPLRGQATAAPVVGSVSGVVFDSLERRPLVGAAVQLVGTDSNPDFSRTAVSDSMGRFVLTDVPVGRFTLGFFHDMLDSLGLEPPLQEVVMRRVTALRVDLALPSPSRLRAAICGSTAAAQPASDSSAMIVGFVRDARDRTPTSGAAVTAEWLEMSFGPGGILRRVPRLVATTGANGWFAICNVPRDGTVAMLASRGADSTDRLELQVPNSGFVRRDMYLDRAILRDTTTMALPLDSTSGSATAIARRRLRFGDGRISGQIVSADSGRAVAGAIVAIRNGPETRANDRGEWVITGAALGTQMLEVRALGYYPSRRPVDVVSGAAPLRVALSATRSVLDTVKVRGQLALNQRMAGFAGRQRSSGGGRFLGIEEIARRQPVMLSDIFRAMPGMELAGDAIRMRGTTLEKCTPDFYINGSYVGAMDAVDLDAIAKPRDVLGIEIYPVGTQPPEFSRGMAGEQCGSVVIWTR